MIAEMTVHEEAARLDGYGFVAGVDEVGRGALAGPIVAAAVVIGDYARLVGVRDSKRLTAKSRERFAEIIKASALAWAVCALEAAEVDSWGIQEANRRVLRGALDGIGQRLDMALVDGMDIRPYRVPVVALAKGDRQSLSIASASIVAKVHRDTIMATHMENEYPGYGFAGHKGYGSAAHIEAITTIGLCPEHRRSFSPCSDLVEAEGTDKENQRVPQQEDGSR